MSHDVVKHPSHYAEGRKYEPKDVIRDWGLNFNLGNTVKYIARAGKKDDIVQDLKKAKQYLEFEIEAIEAERKASEDDKPKFNTDTVNCKHIARPVYDEDVNEEPKAESKNLCDSCVYVRGFWCPSRNNDAKFSGNGVAECSKYLTPEMLSREVSRLFGDK